MNLTASGHQVAVADNYLRRNICREEDSEALFAVPNLHDRAKLWKEISGHKIDVYIGDLCEWDFISKLFIQTKPEVIIHYAEQPSAPYSMLNRNAATLTIKNNLDVTTNVIFAVKEYVPDAHIIKLGTMGEYGTPNIDIEEGWIDIEHKGEKTEISLSQTGRQSLPYHQGYGYRPTLVLRQNVGSKSHRSDAGTGLRNSY